MDKDCKYIAAVDIGTTKIVAIIGKKTDDGRVEILAMSKTPSNGVKRGVVLNIDDTVKSIKTVIDSVEKSTNIKVNNIFVGIAGQHIRSIRNSGYIHRNKFDEPITHADLLALKNDMYNIPIDIGEQIIHVIPQSYTVDQESGVKTPVGMFGKRIDANFHIVIGQVTSVRNIEACIKRLNMNTTGLILEPLASSSAVLTEDEIEAGVVLIDIGGGTTDIAVFYDNILRHTAVIPFGGNIITEDVKVACQILSRQAESLKIQFGSALAESAPSDQVITIPGIAGRKAKEISRHLLAEVIQARVEEIIEASMFEVDNSMFREKLAAGIVVTGGGSLLTNLSQLMSYKTGMDVRIGAPRKGALGDQIKKEELPMYSTSVGLIYKGFEFMEEQALQSNSQTRNSSISESVTHNSPTDSNNETTKKEEKDSNTTKEVKATKRKSKEDRTKPGFGDKMKAGIGNALDVLNNIFDDEDTNM